MGFGPMMGGTWGHGMWGDGTVPGWMPVAGAVMQLLVVEPGGTVTWELESGTHDAVAYHPDNDDKPLRMPDDATPWRTDLLA